MAVQGVVSYGNCYPIITEVRAHTHLFIFSIDFTFYGGLS